MPVTHLESNDRVIDILEVGDTPRGASFPGANAAFVTTEADVTGYTYYDMTASGIDYWGVSALQDGQELVSVNDNGALLLDFPLSYQSTSQSTYTSTFDFSGISTRREGTIESVSDAYGTLTVGEETFSNVLRVKTTQAHTDTVEVSGVSVTVETEVVSYSYFSEAYRYPVYVYSEVTAIASGVRTEAKNAYVLVTGDGGSAVMANRYVPHVTRPGQGFESSLILNNQGDATEEVEIVGFDNGRTLGSQPFTLAAKEIRTVPLGDAFPEEPPTNLAITGSEQVRVSIAYRASVDQAASAHLAEQPNQGRTLWVYPGNWDLVFDGAAIVNVGSNDTDITLTVYDATGQLVQETEVAGNLAPGEKFLATFDSLFDRVPQGLVKFSATQNISAIFLKGSYPGQSPNFLFANQPFTDRDITQADFRWLPHITAPGGGFETEVLLINRGSESQTIQMVGYRTDGSIVGNRSETLAAGATLRLGQDEVFDGDEFSHMSTVGGASITVSVGYRAIADQAATAYVHESTAEENSVQIYLGEGDLVFDGMALVNVGAAPATVTATLLAGDGQELDTLTLESDLAPFAKKLAVFNSTFSSQGGVAVRVQSDQPFHAVFLRGTYVGAEPAYLYTNPAFSD
ncbi:hypothetical protein [Sulfidibacter corallicola]|uniref:Uncharacterized protein n=1 Tax=Sulfidibacter corallicola TaxID=2818388 RepID=A0A8A4TLY7_SULCO|nr:hypothetical protein [Sulfidibacter corallicola]QTD50122.1 hypothetical protein J3U87_31445 [Sulfidibacter corallicola]